jgi:predicted metal-dependent hydrolase
MNSYPQAYLEYLIYFQAERDYFECHEVMEEHWKEHPGDPLSVAFVGLIQLAVGLYHQRRGNRAGSVKMLQSALKHLTPEDIASLGMDSDVLREMIADRVDRLKAGLPAEFVDMDLPILDPLLLEQCQQECLKRVLVWSRPSDCGNEQLIHKHKLRDRSQVIEERNEQIRKRQLHRGVTDDEFA